jgi:hypothetical protein
VHCFGPRSKGSDLSGIVGELEFKQVLDRLQGSSTEKKGMMLVPQKPYMALGTLRQQLLYPVFDAAIISEVMPDVNNNFSKSGLLDFPIESHPASSPDSSKEQQNGNLQAAAAPQADHTASSNGSGGRNGNEAETNGNGKRSKQALAPPDEVLLKCLDEVCHKVPLEEWHECILVSIVHSVSL